MKRKYTAGIDIGGTGTKLGLFAYGGKPVEIWSIPTDTADHGGNIIKNAAESLCRKMKALGVSSADMEGAGIAVPGAVKDGIHAEVCPNIGWMHRDVRAEFIEAFSAALLSGQTHAETAGREAYVAGEKKREPETADASALFRTSLAHINSSITCEEANDRGRGFFEPWLESELLPPSFRVKVMNDAAAAACGEFTAGGGRSSRTMMMVTLGTGVGAAVIADGRLINGVFGCAGEIGHMNVNPTETEKCSCGRRGCLEQYVSAGGIVHRMKKYLESGGKSLLDENSLSAENISDAVYNGDELAERVMKETGSLLGRALATVSCVIDPGLFVIGGGVAEAGEVLLTPVRESYINTCYPPSAGARIIKAELGGNAGVYGCALSL